MLILITESFGPLNRAPEVILPHLFYPTPAPARREYLIPIIPSLLTELPDTSTTLPHTHKQLSDAKRKEMDSADFLTAK